MSPLRNRNSRYSIVRAQENRERIRLGFCRTFSKPDVKNLWHSKEVGYFAGENPASGVELPEYRPVREKHILTPEQVTALLDELTEPFHTMVLLAILTGLRVGEILGLRWENVDFSLALMHVSQRYYRGQMDTPKTKSSKRSLPLPLPSLESLKRHRAKQQSSKDPGLVFQTRKGTPYSDTNILHRELKPAGKKIGAPWLNLHTFRRTHATPLQFVDEVCEN